MYNKIVPSSFLFTAIEIKFEYIYTIHSDTLPAETKIKDLILY